jgi:hypothetical protein
MPTPCSPLAPELLPYVTEERLAANYAQDPRVADRYFWPEEIEDHYQEYLPAVEEALLKLPLEHATDSQESVSQILAQGIIPSADRPHANSHTFPLDRSLGLHRYAFTSWGSFEHFQYGDERVLIPAGLMLEHNVIATKHDITSAYSSGSNALQKPYEENSPSVQAAIDSQYFGEMVTGRNFLDLTARRMLSYLYRSKGGPFPARSAYLGEIKHLGTIPSEAITETLSLDEVPEYTEELLALGFATASLHYKIAYEGYQSNALEAGRTKWRRILGLD